MTLPDNPPVGAVRAKRLWRVWDRPTRLMHWILVAAIAVCWWTGTHDELEYHLYSGYVVLWVCLMRLYWGVVGSSTAKFSSFVRGPREVLNYARSLPRRNSVHSQGHNPVGAISIVLMLAVILSVVGLGLFAVDVDGLYSGPLSSFVSFKLGRRLAHLHYSAFQILVWVIGLHVLAVAFYLVYKRQNLVFPMITGVRKCDEAVDDELVVAPWWRLVVGAALVTLVVWLVWTGLYF